MAALSLKCGKVEFRELYTWKQSYSRSATIKQTVKMDWWTFHMRCFINTIKQNGWYTQNPAVLTKGIFVWYVYTTLLWKISVNSENCLNHHVNILFSLRVIEPHIPLIGITIQEMWKFKWNDLKDNSFSFNLLLNFKFAN